MSGYYYRILLGLLSITLVYCTRQPSSNPRDFDGRPSTASKQSSTPDNTGKPRRTEILFLGDNGHHKPIERVPQLMAALGNRGINITYTDQMADINPENLAKYDGLLIYANWDTIAKPQEKAILDFVASGKGLIPVHCASFCFRNSPEYVKMVGGQFWRHRMDTIQTVHVQPNHPAIMGLQPFKAYDETYLHEKLQPDNNVLATREIKADQAKDIAASDHPTAKTEPYTWTRTHGKGRIFYTAYGHDERTWSQPGFQDLLEKGILWAVGDNVKKLHDALNPQPFTYNEAKLPNYEKRPGPQLRQNALSVEESIKHIQVPVDFSLEVFAHEPDVMHPIAMTWDERGRLFVLITKDYPNERKETGGSDYILMCEDTNKDGKADKFTRWADGLSIPTGMVFANGGLIVSQAPHMLFLKDTDGDDKADSRKILFSGFGTFDTHAGPSNLHYGFDNWIWGCVGYSGYKGKFGTADSLKFGQAFFRFKPDGSDMEWVTSTSNNTWGFAFNETGDAFGSTANNSHGWYMAIPHRYFNSVTGMNANNGSRGTDTHKDMKPITSKVRQVDVFGGFTAASGHNFYTARAYPKNYWNKVAFVCEPTGHVVHQNVMVKKGTDYEDAEGFNLLAGADEWVSPVFAEVGPDGAVWIADWYSFIIQHNPTPQGFKNGTGNAYDTDLRDYTHGRIYRVAYKKAPAYTPISLSKERPQELVAALKNTNMFWRLQAQRLLVERGQKDVVPQLVALVNDTSVDEIGINPAAIHALRTLEGLGALNDPSVQQAITGALKHPCPGVRKTAVQVIPRSEASANALLQANTLNDKEPLVVLNTVLSLTEMPLTPTVESALLARLTQATESNDRWLPDAFACALTSKDGKLMQAYLKQLAAQPKATAMHDHSAMQHNAAATNSGNAATASTPTGDKPDLVVTGIKMEPASPFVRETASMTVTVANMGGVAIPKGVTIPLSIRIEGQNRKIEMVSVVYKDGLEPGQTAEIRQSNNGPWVGNISFGSDVAGDYTMSVVVDRENQIAETKENNNGFTQKINFRQPQKLSTFALERAARSYAMVAPAESVVALFRQSQQISSDDSQALVKGLASGWDPRRKATLNADDQAFMVSLSNSLSSEYKNRMSRLLEAWGVRKANDDLDPNAQIVRIKTVREAMKFDLKEFTVTAGKQVVLILENPDAMQHNLVIGKPKSLEIIGAAADKMITAKDGAEKNYVPAVPQIIANTPLVNPDQTYRLIFTAPAQPGEYPFVCTFPGHWRIMNGVMKVVGQPQATNAK